MSNAINEVVRCEPPLRAFARCAAQQTEILATIERDEPGLANDLRGKLFTFEDLTRLSDRDLQSLMKDLDMKQVTVALKGGSPDVKEKMLAAYYEPIGGTPEQFAALIQTDLVRWGKLIKDVGIKVD